ncbi:unnamed protein product [Darwinula stevensoni]|uniref:Kringle domain-containing protein n=1 Tax=Darwinula stevensoni TaxID=69355 RepID=A0A7R8XAZ9_9CRUS|nr:unnamed protein product [Darwinula stevensoni]CAG0886093.1 unnamed protein product [Darwinula stevensoni]
MPIKNSNFYANKKYSVRRRCTFSGTNILRLAFLRTGVPECKLSQKGGEYVGVKDRTISGFACVPWLDPEGNEGDIVKGVREGSFPDEITDSHNFCRNPNGNPGGPWCNVNDSRKPNLKWEYCDVPFCDFGDWAKSESESESGDQYVSIEDVMQPKYDECRFTKMGKEYTGEEFKTETGKECISWADVVHKGFPLTNFIFSHLSFQDRQLPRPPKIEDFLYNWIGLTSASRNTSSSNVCRNYGSKERPWCFVSFENPSWEYCDIPFCRGAKEPAECKQTDDGREYIGRKNVTQSGKKCQPWLSQTPNEHSTVLYLPAFPDPDMDSYHNYCRNPDLKKLGPWCYNGEGTDPEWEYCDIQHC